MQKVQSRVTSFFLNLFTKNNLITSKKMLEENRYLLTFRTAFKLLYQMKPISGCTLPQEPFPHLS